MTQCEAGKGERGDVSRFEGRNDTAGRLDKFQIICIGYRVERKSRRETERDKRKEKALSYEVRAFA